MSSLRAKSGPVPTPLAVVTSADPLPGDKAFMSKFRPAWVELQDDLASLSSVSLHLTAATRGHFVYQDDPDTVGRGIRFVIDQLHK